MKRTILIILVCLLVTNVSFASSDYGSSSNFYSSDLLTKQQYSYAKSYCILHYNQNQIITLQTKLNELGYNCGTPNGIIANKTIEAIFNFQKAHKLIADGIAGPATLKSLGISSSISVSSKSNNSSVVKVKLVNSYMEYNNHVGNEWGTSVEVNNKGLNYSDEFEVALSSSNSIKLSVFVTEFDSIPDNSSNTKFIKLKDLKSGVNTIPVYATVTENRGRYSGNTAKWVFVFEIFK